MNDNNLKRDMVTIDLGKCGDSSCTAKHSFEFPRTPNAAELTQNPLIMAPVYDKSIQLYQDAMAGNKKMEKAINVLEKRMKPMLGDMAKETINVRAEVTANAFKEILPELEISENVINDLLKADTAGAYADMISTFTHKTYVNHLNGALKNPNVVDQYMLSTVGSLRNILQNVGSYAQMQHDRLTEEINKTKDENAKNELRKQIIYAEEAMARLRIVYAAFSAAEETFKSMMSGHFQQKREMMEQLNDATKH